MSKKDLLLQAIKQKQKHNDVKTLNGKLYIEEIEISLLRENPYQPRLHIEEKELRELANSIKKDGLLQPVPVARMEDKNGEKSYILIAGHRRTEAHKFLGLTKIKATILDNLTNRDLASLALVENVQREDLNYIELAMQYKTLIDNKIFKTVSELSNSIGKNSTEVGRVINLLKLSPKIIEDVKMNNTVGDLKILSAIRQIKDFEKQESVYTWFIDNNKTRNEVLAKVVEVLENNAKKDETSNERIFKINNSEKSCTIKLPSLTAHQERMVENFIESLFKEL